MKGPEARLKDQIKKHLDSLPRCYWYMPVPCGYGKQTLDFLCCIEGLLVGIETKAEGKKPTPRQEACMEQIRKAGGMAFWCDSFDTYISKLGQRFAL